MLPQAGANKVYFVSAAPAVRFPNVYGIDIPTRCELVAYNRSDDEVAPAIGADWVVYQDLDALEDSVRHFRPDLQVQCVITSCPQRNDDLCFFTH